MYIYCVYIYIYTLYTYPLVIYYILVFFGGQLKHIIQIYHVYPTYLHPPKKSLDTPKTKPILKTTPFQAMEGIYKSRKIHFVWWPEQIKIIWRCLEGPGILGIGLWKVNNPATQYVYTYILLHLHLLHLLYLYLFYICHMDMYIYIYLIIYIYIYCFFMHI